MASAAQNAAAAYRAHNTFNNAASAVSAGASSGDRSASKSKPDFAAGKQASKRKKGKRQNDSDVSDSGESESEQKTEQKTEPSRTELPRFLSDLLEGFAEIYRISTGGAQQCSDCVRKNAYPIKERVVESHDAVASMGNSRANASSNVPVGGASAFRHE